MRLGRRVIRPAGQDEAGGVDHATAGGHRAGERPGRARVGDVPGDEWIGRDIAGRHVPRGTCPARVRARAGAGSAPDADDAPQGRDARSSTSTRRGRCGCASAWISRRGSGRTGIPRRRWSHPPLASSRPRRRTRPANGRICWFAEVTPPSLVPPEVRHRPAKSAGAEHSLPDGQQRCPLELRSRRRRGVRQDHGRDAHSRRGPSTSGSCSTAAWARPACRCGPRPAAAGRSSLEGDSKLGAGVRHIFVLRVENGRGAYAYRPALAPGEEATGVIPSMDRAAPAGGVHRGHRRRPGRQAHRVGPVRQGSPGDGQHLEDQLLPERRHPRPVRAAAVVDRFVHPDPDPAQAQGARPRDGGPARAAQPRARAARPRPRSATWPRATRRGAGRRSRYLREQGRYVEPIVRRVAATTQDAGVRTLCRRLLLTDFVTDLRCRHPQRGGRQAPRRRPARAPRPPRQALSRDGDDRGGAGRGQRGLAGAREIGRKGRTRSRRTTRSSSPAGPPCTRPAARIAGPPRSMPAWIEQYVTVAASATSIPARSRSLRERWDGRAYAECLVRAGLADSTIAALQKKLDRLPEGPDGLGEQRSSSIRLAFLLEARGQHPRADAHWTWLGTHHGLALGKMREQETSRGRPVPEDRPLRSPSPQARDRCSDITLRLRGHPKARSRHAPVVL